MRIHVELRVGEGYVAAWICGLPVHAEGPTREEAFDELASALIAYAATWETSLRHAPNHAGNEDLIRRVQAARTVEAVRELLEGGAAVEGVAEREHDNDGPLAPGERSDDLARAHALSAGWSKGPSDSGRRPRRPGALKGRIHITDDFDDLSEDLASAFRGELP